MANKTIILPAASSYSGSEFIVRNDPGGSNQLTIGCTIETYQDLYQPCRDNGVRLIANTDGWWVLKENAPFRETSLNTIKNVHNTDYTVAYPDAYLNCTANASNFNIKFPSNADQNLYGRKITVKKANASVGNVVVNLVGLNTVVLNAQYDFCTVVRYRTGGYKVIAANTT